MGLSERPHRGNVRSGDSHVQRITVDDTAQHAIVLPSHPIQDGGQLELSPVGNNTGSGGSLVLILTSRRANTTWSLAFQNFLIPWHRKTTKDGRRRTSTVLFMVVRVSRVLRYRHQDMHFSYSNLIRIKDTPPVMHSVLEQTTHVFKHAQITHSQRHLYTDSRQRHKQGGKHARTK